MQITAACSSHYRAAVKRGSVQAQSGKVTEIKGQKQKTAETKRA